MSEISYTETTAAPRFSRRKTDVVIWTVLLTAACCFSLSLFVRSLERQVFEEQIGAEMVRLRSSIAATETRQSTDETRQALKAALRSLEYRLINVKR